MHPEEREIVTLYYGNGVNDDDAIALANQVQQAWPDQEVEVVAGGQEHYHYVLSVE
jgi:dihydroxyacetone kinase-like predicted kinase